MATKMKRALIFGSVPCTDWRFLEAYDTAGCPVYCADGGVNVAASAGFRPDFVIGDWDSGGTPVTGVDSVSLPTEKDLTDLQSAMSHACRDGYRDLLLCGALGGPRLDHTVFNLHLLEWLADRGAQGLLVDRDNEVRLLDSETVRLDAISPRYHYFSLAPLDRTVEDVSLTGAKYPLTEATLHRGDSLTVSNEPTGSDLTVRVGRGRLLLIRSQRDDLR